MMFLRRADVIYRTGIPAPFSISTYNPSQQLIQPFRQAYVQSPGGPSMPIASSGPMNGLGSFLIAEQPVAMSALQRAQALWANRPQVLDPRQAIMWWSGRGGR